MQQQCQKIITAQTTLTIIAIQLKCSARCSVKAPSEIEWVTYQFVYFMHGSNKMQSVLPFPWPESGNVKATVLSPVSDSLVFNQSFPRAHSTTTLRQEKWFRIFQLSFPKPQSIKSNFPFVCFSTFSLLYDPCSVLDIALYLLFYSVSVVFLMLQSFCQLIGAFQLDSFSSKHLP